MDMKLSDEQVQLRDSARALLENECTAAFIREMEKSEAGFSREMWKEMAGLVTDEMVDAVAVVAPHDELAVRLRDRYDGVLDRIGIHPGEPLGLDEDEESALVADLRG